MIVVCVHCKDEVARVKDGDNSTVVGVCRKCFAREAWANGEDFPPTPTYPRPEEQDDVPQTDPSPAQHHWLLDK